MNKTEADDVEFQRLVEHHKADIQSSNMNRDELIELLARNLASYNLLTKCQEAIIKATEQNCDLLKKQNSDTERKLLAATNAIPEAVESGINAGFKVGKKVIKWRGGHPSELKPLLMLCTTSPEAHGKRKPPFKQYGPQANTQAVTFAPRKNALRWVWHSVLPERRCEAHHTQPSRCTAQGIL